MINSLPKIAYPILKKGNKTTYKTLTDISHHLRLTRDTINNIVNYDQQNLYDGEGLEVSAGENYGRTDLYYVLELANDRFDWRDSRPLMSEELDSLVSEKYAHRNDVHHYINEYGLEVDNTYGVNETHIYPQKVIPITNYEYEEEENNKKRRLNVVKPSDVNFVENLVKSEIGDFNGNG